jgi:hypothetical protein
VRNLGCKSKPAFGISRRRRKRMGGQGNFKTAFGGFATFAAPKTAPRFL